MPLDSAKLVEEALRVCGGDRSKLAKRLGITSYGEDKIGRWLRAQEGGPQYEDTIRLLELVGWLNKGAGRRKAAPALDDPLAKLEATVDQMADRTAAALEQLQTDVTELSARIPPADDQHQETG